MPEIPELENIKAFLSVELPGVRISSVEAPRPLVIRLPARDEFIDILGGNSFRKVGRRGKFMLFHFETGHLLAVNPMLTGRLLYTKPSTRRHVTTCFILTLDNGKELRYFDSRSMGKVYLVPEGQEGLIPGYERMGPEALDLDVTLEVFTSRLRRHPGQIKNILVNANFLAGIGNAYADEILFAAGIYPYRRRPTLTQAEVRSLYDAIHSVLQEATEMVAHRMGGRIEVKVRDFLKIHGKGHGPCPRCGGHIGQVRANRWLTNFCRTCQK